MNQDWTKLFGIVLVILEMMLASCLVLISFLYGFWLEASLFAVETSARTWIIEGLKRQLVIAIAGIIAAWLIHTVNTYWIERTKFGSRRNSYIFSIGVFLMVFFSGLAGVLIFIFQRPGA